MRKGWTMLIAVMFLATAAQAASLEKTYDRTFEVTPATQFALDNTNGRVTLRAWDEPRVLVRALERVESRDASEANQAMAALSIVPTATTGRLKIETKMPPHSEGLLNWIAGTNVNINVDYDITVPRSMNLQIDNTNGAIDIAEVRGSMRVSNTNGHIECRQCAGDMDAETTNGAIRVELGQVNPGRPIHLETTNGRVTVVLPKSIGARIDASTTNGSVDSDLPVTTTEVHHNALRGTVNGGGVELRLRSTNGSISIEAR